MLFSTLGVQNSYLEFLVRYNAVGSATLEQAVCKIENFILGNKWE